MSGDFRALFAVPPQTPSQHGTVLRHRLRRSQCGKIPHCKLCYPPLHKHYVLKNIGRSGASCALGSTVMPLLFLLCPRGS